MILHRKGVALLWVVLASALILVAVMGISMRIVPQKQVANATNYSERALAVAESGLAKTTYLLRTSTDIQTALQASSKYDSGVKGFNSGVMTDDSTYDSTYRVIIIVKPVANGYTFYALGTYGTGGSVLARQAISVQYSINFPFGKYALYSEKKIDLQTGIISGDVYGNNITIKNGKVTEGKAYYTDPLSSVPSEIPSQQVAQVSFPTIDMNKYRAQWKAFLNGDAPYDGSPGYPNTKNADVHGFIISTLGGSAGGLIVDVDGKYSGPAYQSTTVGSGTNKTTVGFEEFFRQLRTGSTADAAYLNPAAYYLYPYLGQGKLIFDVRPNTSGGEVDFNDAQLFSGAPYLEGVVIVEGDLKLSSNNLQIGVNPSKTAVLVSGMCTVGNAATINGFLYIAGEGKHGNDPLLSCKASGGLTVNGSIVAKGTISAGSAGLSVTWKANDVYNENLVDIVPAPSAVPSSWRQISYDAFLDAAK